MFNKLLRKLNLIHEPVPYDYTEVMKAWKKISSVLNSATTRVHVEVAANMFTNMLHQFAFTPEQCASPIIMGMDDEIKARRGEFEIMRESTVSDGRSLTRVNKDL